MQKTSPPQPNELELSLFGAGIGECIVLHLGAGNWMIVDSCLNATRQQAVSLDYLDALNVDIARQVKLVVATHWHDDHIRGIGQVMRFASSAEFACSEALQCKEFFTLVAADDAIKLVESTSSVSEFCDVLEALESRSNSRFRIGPNHWASHAKRIYAGAKPFDADVYVLSPSAQTITDAKGELAGLIPRVGDHICRFPRIGPNDLSVVLLITTCGPNLLLGSDLATGRDQHRGWQAILASKQRPQVMSDAYKVAHHGSAGSDLEAVWKCLLSTDPLALITPYARGRKPLPAPEDIARIKSYTHQVYCTATPPITRPQKRHGVDRTMGEVTRSRRAIRSQPGHIRVRVPIDSRGDQMSIELFDGAKQL